MPRILVHFYGYKSKELPHAVKSLLSNSSGQNDIDVVVFDQLNLERREKFENVEYNYIHWDNLKSRFSYLNDSKSKDGYDFFLYVDGAKVFQGNWDMELVMGHGGRNVVMSGNHSILFNKDNYRFYSDYTLGDIDHTLRTNWIVKDFIFTQNKKILFLQITKTSKYFLFPMSHSTFCLSTYRSIGCHRCSTITTSSTSSSHSPLYNDVREALIRSLAHLVKSLEQIHVPAPAPVGGLVGSPTAGEPVAGE